MEDDSQSLEDDSQSLDVKVQHIYRRLDRRIIPCLWVLYFLGSSARSNIGLSATMNTAEGNSLLQTVPLTKHQFSLGVTLFYVAYIVIEIPSNLMSKYRIQCVCLFADNITAGYCLSVIYYLIYKLILL